MNTYGNIEVSLNQLEGNEGLSLAKPIYNQSGGILCQEGKILNPTIISQLKKYFKNQELTISVKNENASTVVKDDILNEEDIDIPNFLGQELYKSTLETLKNIFPISKQNIENTIKIADEFSDNIIKLIKVNQEISYSLGQYKDLNTNNNVFKHSIQVAQFAVALANIYNRSINLYDTKIDLKTIAIAALLHDYGTYFKDNNEMKKLSKYKPSEIFFQNFPMIPQDILQQPYNDNYRTVYAYLVLKNYLPSDIVNMILLSSESNNGSIGLHIKNNKNDAISIGSRIIFLCNLYDSLLCNTIGKDQSLENINLMLEHLSTNGVTSKNLTGLFTENFPLYSEGVRVLLSTGDYATIIERFKGKDSSKPIVKTLVASPLQPKIIDLRNTTNITISEIIASSEKLSDKIKEITKIKLETTEIDPASYNCEEPSQKEKKLIKRQ